MDKRELETLGEPAVEVRGLRLWVHGRQFPDAADYWDGNWLRVTAYCVYPNATVRAHGSLIHLGELVSFLRQSEHLYQSLQGRASLDCMEPNLNVQIQAESGGRMKVDISITPDQMTESHTFADALDQTHLPSIIAAIKHLLAQYPLREPDKLPT